MSVAGALTITTLVLAAVTVLLLVVMTVAHLIRLGRQRRRRRLAASGTGLLVRVTDGGDAVARERLVAMDPRHWSPLEPVALRLLETVSGQPRADLVEVFERRGVAVRARRETRRRSAVRRARAAHTLGLLAHRPALEDLYRLLADPHADVRYSAARALGRIADPAAAQPLLAAVVGDRTIPAHVVGHALLRLGPGAVPVLRAAIEDDEPQVRMVAIDVLGRCAVYDAVPGLLAALVHDQVIGVRVQAAGALARLGLPQAVRPLLDAADSQHPALRAAAVHALSALGDPSAVPKLRGLLADLVHEVARDAAQALAGLGAAGVAALEQVAADSSPVPATYAKSALARAALRSHDGRVRAAASHTAHSR